MGNVAKTTIGAAAVWLALAWLLGSKGAVHGFPLAVVGACVWGGLAVLLVVYLGLPAARRWAMGLPPGWVATFHLWRLAPGIYFLVLYGYGVLPARFAVPGGLGDIAVALTAPLAGFWLGARTPGRRGWLIAWHALGFVDLAQVVGSGMRLRLAGDTLILHMGSDFPLYLLPLYAVPITLAAHVLGIVALWPGRR
jgi:hypothetical protein